MTEPIVIRCEGSGAEPTHALCPMCGVRLALFGSELIPEHTRIDILAMLDRGDYD